MHQSLLIKRRFFLINALFAMFCMGASYAWGVFVVPLENQFGWIRTQTSLAFTLNLLFFAAGITMTGILSRRFRYALLMRAGALMMGSGFLLSSQCTQVWQLYFTYSFLCGFGAGLGYNSVVSSVPQWFPEKPALTTGILLVGYAMSSAMFGPLSNFMIFHFSISSAFLLIAAVSFCGLMIASFNIRVPSDEQKAALPAPSLRRQQSRREVPTSVMLKELSFWLCFFILAFVSGSGMLFINHLSPMLTEELGSAASVAAAVISVVFFFNASGRIIGGFFLDRFGVKITIYSVTGLMILALTLAALGLRSGSTTIVIISGTFSLFAFGANANMIPCMVRELFGQKFFSLNYAMMNLNSIIVAVMPTIASSLHAYFGGYFMAICCFVGLNIFTFLLTIILVKKHRS